MKKGGTAAAAGSIIFAMIFNMLLFVAAPLLLTNALFIAAGWAPSPAAAVVCEPQPAGADRTDGWQHTADADGDAAWYSRAWRPVKTYLHPVRPSVAFNLIDGVIRMTFLPDHDLQFFAAEGHQARLSNITARNTRRCSPGKRACR